MEALEVGSNKSKRTIADVIKYLVLIVVAAASLYPFLWVLLSSFKTLDEIMVHPMSLPKRLLFSNYVNAWVKASIGKYYFNTFIVSIVAVALIVLISAMAAYILSRVRPSFMIYTYFSLGLMIPIQAVIVPCFVIFFKAGLNNTRLSLILAYTAVNLSMAIFIMYGFMKELPRELEEAAVIDGCSRYRTFFSIMLPLSLPGLSTVAILNFLNCWNEFLLPLVLMTDKAKKVLSQGINDLNGQYFNDYGVIFAAILLMTLPVVIIYILFQEQVIRGMTAGAVKG